MYTEHNGKCNMYENVKLLEQDYGVSGLIDVYVEHLRAYRY